MITPSTYLGLVALFPKVEITLNERNQSDILLEVSAKITFWMYYEYLELKATNQWDQSDSSRGIFVSQTVRLILDNMYM